MFWLVLPAAAVELTLPVGEERARWEREIAEVEAVLPMPPTARIDVTAVSEQVWRVTVTSAAGQLLTDANRPLLLPRGAVREVVWVAASTLTAARSTTLVSPPPRPPRPAPVGPVEPPEPVLEPPHEEPPTEVVVAEGPVPLFRGRDEVFFEFPSLPVFPQPPPPATLPPPPDPSTEIAISVAVASDGVGGGMKVELPVNRFLVEGRVEGRWHRAVPLAASLGLGAARPGVAMQAGAFPNLPVTLGPIANLSMRPTRPAGPWLPHLGVGAGGRLQLTRNDLGVTLRADGWLEPKREQRLLTDPDGRLFTVQGPLAFVTIGIDVGTWMRVREP